jgi:hypothetical protein
MNKKIIPITITTAIILSLTACSDANISDKEVTEEQSQIIIFEDNTTNDTTETDTTTEVENANASVETEQTTETEPTETAISTSPSMAVMVMFNDKIYYDTGTIDNGEGRCGVMDGSITSKCDYNEIPTENNQSNFGTGYGIQYGRVEGEIEVCIDGEWYIFTIEHER